MRPRPTLLALILVALLAVPSHGATFTVDGSLDPDYGSPYATQTRLTWITDATAGQPVYADGGELDAGWAIVDGDSLRLFLSGNLQCQGNPSDPGTFYDVLVVFLDTGPGGLAAIQDESGYPNEGLNGFTFDAGNSPEWALILYPRMNDPYVPTNPGELTGFFLTLAPGGSTWTFLGRAALPGAGGFAGGSNPSGIRATLDNRNTAGVGAGCGMGSGAGVTTGVECVIPLAAIGSPAACLRITAALTYELGADTYQVLPPLPDGLCPPGSANVRDFANLAGEQFATICPQGTPTRHTTWGRLKSTYR